MKFSPLNTHSSYKLISAFLKELFLSFSMIVLVAIFPTTANAGLFSSIFGTVLTPASAEVTSGDASQTSQNMTLPAPAANINPSPVLAEDIVPISGNALVAEVGLNGTTADVDQTTNTQISVYVVRPGDSLSKIAQLFGVSVNTILWANDLNSHASISEGQTLVILPMSGIQYIVKKGDTLQSIVKKYSADQNEVLQYNDITIDSALAIGQTILIPDAELGTPEGLATTPSVVGKKINGVLPRSEWGEPGTEPLVHSGGPLYATCDEITPGCVYLRPLDINTPGYHKTQGLHGYNAVDLAAPAGTPIHASADGLVIISRNSGSWNGGYGNYVVISHENGTQTLYAHMKKTLVSVGQQVTQGQTIGLVGMTGMTTGPHVHFEIRGAQNPF